MPKKIKREPQQFSTGEKRSTQRKSAKKRSFKRNPKKSNGSSDQYALRGSWRKT